VVVTIALDPPRVVRNPAVSSSPVVHRSSARVGLGEPWRFGFIGLATAGLVAYSTAIPLLALYRFFVAPVDPGRAVYAVAALACVLPLQIWLVLSAARGERTHGQAWALVAMTAVILGMVPVIGVGWFGAMYVLGGLVLVYLPPRWSYALFAALVVAQAPLTFALGHPDWASYFTIGLPALGLPLAVAVWLVDGARQLQAARLALAEEAVIRERLRIDDELRRTVGAALEAIAAQGERAGDLVPVDPAGSAGELRALAHASRGTLAEARRLVTRYQEVSLRSELETAATLLAAAGIPTRLDLPAGELPDTAGEAERTALRREIARLLAGTTRAPVTIAVTRRDGQVRLELLSRRPATVGASR